MIRVLGDVSIDRDEDSKGGRGPGQTYKRLVAVLAAEANTSVSAESLMEALWSSADTPKSARASFRNFCSRLRRELQSYDAELVVDSQSGLGSRYMLRVSDRDLDHLAFQGALEESERREQSSEIAEAAELLEGALELWGGAAFNDVDLARVQPLRQQLEDLRIVAYERLASLYYRMGRYDAAVHLLNALARANPERERLAGVLMRSLYRTGRARDALNVYQETRQALADSGLTVATELVELERAILIHEQTLGGRGGPASQSGNRRGPFVGRKDLVSEIIDGANSGASFFCVSADAGMGKSRLLAEVAAAALDYRIAVIVARPGDDYPTPLDTFDQLFEKLLAISSDTESLAAAYSVLRSGLRSPADARSRLGRLKDLVRQLTDLDFVGFERVVLAVDDAHSIDELSLFVLREWARTERRKVSIVVLARPAPAGTAWGRFLADISTIPESSARTLRPLDAQDVADWLRSLDQRPAIAPESLAPALCQHARGNPYLIGHLIRDMVQSSKSPDALRRLVEAWLPDDLAHVVRSRLDRLDDPQRRFLAAAAVVGRRFRVGEVASIARAVLDDVDTSFDLRKAPDLLVGPDRSGYLSFDHDLTRVAMMDYLADDELKLLHAGVYRTLARNARPSWELAHHACAAVPLIEPALALQVASRAAAELFSQSSFSAAAGFFQTCVDLVPAGDQIARDEFRLQRARAMQQLGLRSEAVTEFSAILNRCIGSAPNLAAEAALAAAEFADVLDVDDPVEEMLVSASTGAISDPALQSRLALELSINRSIKGLSAYDTIDDGAGLGMDGHDLEQGLGWLHLASGSPSPMARLEVAQRLSGLGGDSDRVGLLTDLALFELAAFLELGAAEEARRARASFDALVEAEPLSTKRWLQVVLDADQLQGEGHLDEAADAAMRALVLGKEIDNPDAGATYGCHALISAVLTSSLDTLDWERDGEHTTEGPLVNVAGGAAVFAAKKDPRASAFLEAAIAGIERAPTSTLTPGILGLASEAAAILGAADASEILLAKLAPYSGYLLRMGLVGGCLGPADFHFGRLEALLGRVPEAADRLHRATVVAHAAELPVWEARCMRELNLVRPHFVDRGALEALAGLIEGRSPQLASLGCLLREAPEPSIRRGPDHD